MDPPPAAPGDRSKRLSAGPRTTSEARWFLRAALRDRDEPLEDRAAELLTAEAVSNAARHGKEPIDLNVALEEERLRVSVFDRGSGFDQANRSTGGLGITLIDRLSTAWGVDVRPDGTEVWFEI